MFFWEGGVLKTCVPREIVVDLFLEKKTPNMKIWLTFFGNAFHEKRKFLLTYFGPGNGKETFCLGGGANRDIFALGERS